jgi:hypothetical protein
MIYIYSHLWSQIWALKDEGLDDSLISYVYPLWGPEVGHLPKYCDPQTGPFQGPRFYSKLLTVL